MFLDKMRHKEADQIPHTNYIGKKEKMIIETYEEPLMPKLCKTIYRCMIILTVSLVLVDFNAFIRYDVNLGKFHLFYNISTTGFLTWVIFSIILIPLSYGAIWQTGKRFWKRVRNTEIERTNHEIENNKARNERALKRLIHSFIHYIYICFIGMIVWGGFYLIMHFNKGI